VGRRAFVSGNRKQNTIKTTVVSDRRAARCAGAVRPGRMHDQTAVNTEGIQALLRQSPTVTARVDSGSRAWQGVPDQVCAPPPAPAKDASAEAVAAYQQARTRQSSQRICVEHAIAEHKQWRPLQRYLGRREAYAETYLASPAWSPPGPPAVTEHQPDRSGRHAQTPIAHQVVSRRRRRWRGRRG
jgi:hypothetical protein